ncbi:MAG: ATP-binding cassette domain-containing protein [Solirubrobacteraceae bacterium]|nr:ATP-binding cassette domain-containing protein [Solirubrobacteraceae bacterium]
MSAHVRLEGVDKAFPARRGGGVEQVLQDLSLEIRPGELVALVGASGCGKTTILNLLAGLERPDAGRVVVEGEDEGGAARAPRLGVVFQQPRLLDWATVRDNVALAARSAGLGADGVDDALRDVGLGDHLDAFPTTLSGGQRQRVAIARAFIVDPDLVLLDEPFSALDELTARRLRLQLQRLWLDGSRTGVLVTHNPQEAAFLADRILVLGRRPAEIVEEHVVRARRPRSPEDDEVFRLHASIVAGLA